MEKNRKTLKHSTQSQSISSNDLTARNKKYALWKNSKISLNREIRSKNVNISEQSTSPQNSQQNESNLQVQSKFNKSTDRGEKSDSVSIVSTNNTEREIAETLYLLKKEISEWKARDSSRSRLEDSEKLIISSDEEKDKKKFDEINSQPEGIEALCLELDKIRTSGSAIISTFRHQCDSERFKDTEDEDKHHHKPSVLPKELKAHEESNEREEAAMETIPTFEYSFINKPTLLKETNNQDILFSEKGTSQKNLSLSPQTTQLLSNVETLLQNAQKQLSEIKDNISFHKKNPELSNAQPTIDEDLLRLRQIVAIKFHEANNKQSKMFKDHSNFSTFSQVQENNTIKAPRLLRLMTMLPEKCHSNLKATECCKNKSHYLMNRMTHYSQFSHSCNKADIVSDENKAIQTDAKEIEAESPNFQIQTGPNVIIKRSLQVQNLDHFHVSPESSCQETRNVGLYNFQHHSEQIGEKCTKQTYQSDGENSEKKQIFKKTVVLKIPEDTRRGTSNVTTKGNNLKETNNAIITESHTSNESALHPKISKECNTNLPYSSNLENSPKNPKEKEFYKDDISQMENSAGNKNKPTIIANEKVNFQYRDIFKRQQPKSLIPKLSIVGEKLSQENTTIDRISLEKLSLLDLNTIIKRNNETIENVIQTTDLFLKSMSPKIEIRDVDYINEASDKFVRNGNKEDGSKKINQELSLEIFKSPIQQLESIKSTLVENFPEIYFSEKENELIPENRKQLEVSKTFNISPKSETVTNSQSINLSQISLSLMSSTKNMIFQNLLPSTVTKSSKDASKDETLNDLKDLSVEIFSDKAERFFPPKSSEKTDDDDEKTDDEKTDDEKTDDKKTDDEKIDDKKTDDEKEYEILEKLDKLNVSDPNDKFRQSLQESPEREKTSKIFSKANKNETFHFELSAKDEVIVDGISKLEKDDEEIQLEEIKILDKQDTSFFPQNLNTLFVDKDDKDNIKEEQKQRSKEAENQSKEIVLKAEFLETEKLNQMKSPTPNSYEQETSQDNYSQNFTEISTTSKQYKSLESHVSLKLSNSFMSKGENSGKKETSVEFGIQRKLNSLLDMEKQISQSIEESLKMESKKSDSQSSLKRKSLTRAETFIIKKSNLDNKEEGGKSQEGNKLKKPLKISERSRKIDDLSSETYSEGEINWPSSSSYSLGEIRGSQGEKISLKIKNRKQNSSSSTVLSNSASRSLGEFSSLK
ncbi:titin homolog [Leptopilina heterotoma]|uniref:titin homolog n=1 Tax=Leptopilina heterotoma TaxID=63436 RepID=UPI001CA87910|nr:titin homolog [Leptopilina heterotoma]XP_043461743.1 titin homolog [Leptopilina heterotoma]XP_043461744.1 titin homolog [Leptopilina heterotoma]